VLNSPRLHHIITIAESDYMSHNSLVSGPNLMILESYESLKSLFANEKMFHCILTSHLSEISAQVRWLKLGILDSLAFKAELEGQMKS